MWQKIVERKAFNLMEETQKTLFGEVRRQEIVSLVKKKNRVTVDELGERFSVSAATIRKDLAELDQLGMLKRTHGGAISRDYADYEQTSGEKEGQNVAQKQAIAKLALQFIHPGDVIALDTGTTTFELARQIVDIPNLTVITNDLKIADFLEQNSDITIVLLGGMLRHKFHCTIGSSVLSALETLYVDTLFVATNGISVNRGLSTFRMEIAEIKRKMIAVSARVIALADSTKVNNETFSAFAGIQEIDVLITDSNAEQKFVVEAVSLGVDVIQAQV